VIRALFVVVVVWIGITTVGWLVDLAHRGLVIALVGVVLLAGVKFARKS